MGVSKKPKRTSRKKLAVEQQQETSKVFNHFYNEYVSVLVSHNVKTAHGVVPLVVNGFLVDEDDDYFYLGQTKSRLDRVIKKDRVIHIEMSKEGEEDFEYEGELVGG